MDTCITKRWHGKLLPLKMRAAVFWLSFLTKDMLAGCAISMATIELKMCQDMTARMSWYQLKQSGASKLHLTFYGSPNMTLRKLVSAALLPRRAYSMMQNVWCHSLLNLTHNFVVNTDGIQMIALWQRSPKSAMLPAAILLRTNG